MNARIENGKLIIEVDVNEASIAGAQPSSTGKSKLLNKGGSMPIGVFAGHKISASVMVSAVPLK